VNFRRWVSTHVLKRSPINTERLFDRLYRMARELERRPDRLHVVMQDLMSELFDPSVIELLADDVQQCQIKAKGTQLIVPLPHLTDRQNKLAFSLKYANRGRRTFNEEDALLVDRIVDQIDRALRYDKAVEQGRSEERMRLAQDLHDDIGARLLTLMYQAPNASMEEYIRHTLQDLKTLTRGLAVENQTLTEAASEWKRDMDHRLQVASCELDWQFSGDQDPTLTVVQWSALTRILRELVNNTLSHAKATHVKVELSLLDDRLRLVVADNGVGHDPAQWKHGLGLGGVRKRVKQLGGQVTWQGQANGGISCEVQVPQFSGLNND
jgi:signal transduction histidine kinase